MDWPVLHFLFCLIGVIGHGVGLLYSAPGVSTYYTGWPTPDGLCYIAVTGYDIEDLTGYDIEDF